MKPADITLDMVRNVMRNSAAWHDIDAKAHGRWTHAEEVVWFVHGLDGGLRAREGWEAFRKHQEEVRATLTWANNGAVKEPTPGQLTVVRKHLATLVDEGLLALNDTGNGKGFAWITDEMREARAVEKQQRERFTALRDRLYHALGGQESTERHMLSVTSQLQPKRGDRGRFVGSISIQVDEQLATEMLAWLEDRADDSDAA